MAESIVGIGIIGCGYWGPNLVRNFSEVSDAQVVAVADLQPERLTKIAARYPSINTTTDHTDLLRDSRIDAIVVATPVGSHYELARQALLHDKHVLVEKPLTTSSQQAEELIELATRRNLTLMVDHTFIYTGAVQKIHELVALGQVGRPYYYDSVRVNLGLFQHDVSVLWDLAVHDLSIMDYVLGETPIAVSATGMSHVTGEPENVAFLTLFFEDDLIAHIHINWLAPVKVRRTLIGGSRRMIVYDDLEPSEKVKVYDKGISLNGHHNGNGNGNGDQRHRLLIDYRAGDMWAPKIDATEALLAEARHFAQCVRQTETPLTDGLSGQRVVRILEAATASMAERGRPTELSSERIFA